MTARTFNDPHGTSLKARQGLLDNRCQDSKPKRHRTQKRAKRLSALKRQAIKHATAVRAARIKKFNERARRYWLGQREAHP